MHKNLNNKNLSRKIRSFPAGQILGSGLRSVSLDCSKAGQPCNLNAAAVILRLEEAGSTVLAMRSSGYSTHMRQMRFDIVHTALEAYGWEPAAIRPSAPSSMAISAMDEAFGWLRFIPEESFLLRRILGARALVHPLTARHLFPWRRLAATLGADHKSVQRWHGNGVAIIVRSLRQLPLSRL